MNESSKTTIPPCSSRSFSAIRLLVLSLICVPFFGGCNRKPQSSTAPILDEASGKRTGADFKTALKFLSQLDNYENVEAEKKILYHLRKWLREEDPNVNWIADPMGAQIPKQYAQLTASTNLARNEIRQSDVRFLKEAIWLHSICNNVLEKNEVLPDVQKRLDEIKSQYDAKLIQPLRQTYLLFDWVVRNLQTDAPEDSNTPRYGDYFPIQVSETLLMGHGTTSEKTRVFVLLARQMGLEVIVLGFKADDGSIREWLPALFVGNQLFLFDLKIGLPIPMVDGTGIATLEHLLEHRDIIQTLSVGRTRYGVRRSELNRIVAMIEGSPEALSQRMANIESAMTGTTKLVLTTKPAPLRRKLQELKGITAVELWDFPFTLFTRSQGIAPKSLDEFGFEIAIYQSPVDDSNNAFTKKMIDTTRTVDRRVSLIQGRLLQLRGQYKDEGAVRGARTQYFGLRKPDSEIEQIISLPLISAEGQLPTAEEKEQHRKNLLHFRKMYFRIKQNASYWLGIMSLDRGEYAVARDLLVMRTIEAFPDGPWLAGARYNAGRALEALGIENNDPQLLKQAKAMYESDTNSNQRLQSLLRAQRL